MQRRDLAGMCADFAQACSLGNCQNLARGKAHGAMRAMSQPVLLKVYGGFHAGLPRLHEALRQIAATALPAENVCVAP